MKHPMVMLPLALIVFLSISCSSKKNPVEPPIELDTWTQVNGIIAFNNIVVQGNQWFTASAGGVYVSNDSGADWGNLNYARTYSPGTLAIKGDTMFDAINLGDPTSYWGTLFASTDNGFTWNEIDSALVLEGVHPGISCLVVKGSDIFAGTLRMDKGGAFKSTNNGQSWTSMSFPPATYPDVISLKVIGSNIFAGVDQGLYRSTDDGDTWANIDNGDSAGAPAFIFSMAFAGGNIYAGGQGGAFLSKNSGSSWTKITNNLQGSSVSVFFVAVHDSEVYVASDTGVFLSKNNGSSWTNITDNLHDLPSKNIGTIAVVDNELLVNTPFGVWRRRL